MVNFRNNNNGEQPSNSTGAGTLTASSTELVASIAIKAGIPSTMIMPSNPQELMVFPFDNIESP